MKKQLSKWLPDLVVIALFAVISTAYFFQPTLDNKILAQHDAAVSTGSDTQAHAQKEGETSRWTNGIFGGMPTYQIAPGYPSTRTLGTLENIYSLFLPDYIWYVFVMMLGFFILLRAFNVSTWLAGVGAIFWAFSSYYFIIMAAGHIWKLVTLAFIPPTIAGLVLVYQKKYLLGGVITALFVAAQIHWNHVQMSYYFLFVMFFIVIAFGIEAFRKKERTVFWKASGVLFLAALLGVCVNLSNLYHTYQYSKQTIRAKSELTQNVNPADQTKDGLERSYITQWSYGIGETFTLLIPNTKGGASVQLSKNETAMAKANPTYTEIYSQVGQYWGEQPGTSGPVYVGAFVLFLFFMALFIVKTPLKWALLAATVLSILLSWGKNMMGFTDFFLDYVPLYDKFRSVSSILVIAEFCIPLLAVLGLQVLISTPDLFKKSKMPLYISAGLTAGVAFLFAVAPTLFFSFVTPLELESFKAGLPSEHLNPFVDSLKEMRMAIFTADAWRSFGVVLIGMAILGAFLYKKIDSKWMLAGVAILCLTEMWSVNKRYLNDDDFVSRSDKATLFAKTAADDFILKDTEPDFRVLNLSVDTFNDGITPHWHSCIGGYHAAKLRRYQELISYRILPEINKIKQGVSEAGWDLTQQDPQNLKILNMLNTKYIILPTQQGPVAQLNPNHNGHAWFVNQIMYVETADEEIGLLGTINPQETVIVNKRFKGALNGMDQVQKDLLSTIQLTDYKVNHLTYQTKSAQAGVAVFSEIYYPDWQVYIDGKEVDFAQVNYVLRGLSVPAGEHKIEFRFDPPSIHVTESIAYGSMGLLLLTLLGLGSFKLFQSRKQIQK